MRIPFPATRGLGSPDPTTTRAMPASRMASVQGGWRPWWQQGSRVTYMVAPGGGDGAVGQRLPLGVEAAAPPVPALADDLAVLDDHSPHHGVGAGPPRTPPGQIQGQAHIPLVVHLITSQKMPRTRASRAGKESEVTGVPGKKKTPECKTIPERSDLPTATPAELTCFRLLPSRLYCRFWNCTKSCRCALADCTADREFHPALKTLIQLLPQSIAGKSVPVKGEIVALTAVFRYNQAKRNEETKPAVPRCAEWGSF